ncbi:hypothetical protein ACFXMT_33450 [Streptomyces mirabilis]
MNPVPVLVGCTVAVGGLLHSCGMDVCDPVSADRPAAALPTAKRAS